MLEIICTVIGCVLISRKAKAKGYSQGKWIGYAIGAFFGCYILGILFVTAVFRKGIPFTMDTMKHATSADFLQIFTIVIIAAGGLLFVNYRLDQIPAKKNDDNWMDRIGKQE